jgi:hypothetical protein
MLTQCQIFFGAKAPLTIHHHYKNHNKNFSTLGTTVYLREIKLTVIAPLDREETEYFSRPAFIK